MAYEQDPRDEAGIRPYGEYAPTGEEEAHNAPPPAAESGQKTSGKAIASLVCGIIGLIVAGIILGIIAVVLGVVARREIAANPRLGGNGLATAGIVIGAIAFVLAVVILITVGVSVFG
jgi:hypothetical protein